MKVALKGRPDIPFATPPGMTLQQVPEPSGQMVQEAFKPGQTPGAQSAYGLLGGGDALSTPTTPANGTTTPNTTTPGSTAPTNGTAPPSTGSTAPPSVVDKSLGGLY